MALYPRQNSNSCLQHCCFELLLVFTFQYSTSTIQHCPFIIQCAYFKCNVAIRCKMRYASDAIQHPCFLHSQSIPLFCFQISLFNMQHSCLSMQFWYSIYGCCCAECDMLVTRSNILVWTLNFTVEWPDLELVGRWTKYVASKIRGLKHPRFWDADGNGKWTFFACWETIVSQVGKKYLVMWMRLCEGELKVKTAHFRLLSASQRRVCLIKPPIARGVPVVPNVPGDTVMVDSSTSGKASANNAKATLRRAAEQLLTLK